MPFTQRRNGFGAQKSSSIFRVSQLWQGLSQIALGCARGAGCGEVRGAEIGALDHPGESLIPSVYGLGD